jgi:adenosylcobinamide-GDP ribazoletransferase
VGAAAVGRADLGRSVPFFPLVGGLLGLAVAGVYIAARVVLSSFVAAALAIGVGVALTGALHEDGLGDTVDALGGRSREEALGILKDPAHGTYGVLAISLGLLLRVGALSGLDGWSALAVLSAAHALSRGAATGEGLGASYAAEVSSKRVVAAIFIAVAIGLAALGVWAVPACLLTAVVASAVGRLAFHKFGGLTGDVLGAAQQAAEILVLLLGAAVVTKGWPGLPW